MSAVMIKIGIYGIIRTVFDFSGFGMSPDFAWWGMLLVTAGSVSALIGVLYAVVERDIKRALAFSRRKHWDNPNWPWTVCCFSASFHLTALSVLGT